MIKDIETKPEAKQNEFVIAKGKCMLPLIKHGDLLIVKHAKPEDILVGDIIAFQRYGIAISSPYHVEGEFNCHRVVQKYKADGVWYFKERGDNYLVSSTIAYESILGKVKIIIKPEITINLDDRIWRITNYLLSIYFRFSWAVVKRAWNFFDIVIPQFFIFFLKSTKLKKSVD